MFNSNMHASFYCRNFCAYSKYMHKKFLLVMLRTIIKFLKHARNSLNKN